MTILQLLGTPISPWKCQKARTPKPLPHYEPLIRMGDSTDSSSTASLVRVASATRALCSAAPTRLVLAASWPLPVSVSLSAASVSFPHISVFEAPLRAPPSLCFLYTYFLYPIPFLMFYFYIPFILIFVYILFLYLLFLIYHTVNYPQTSLVSETLTTLCICNGISTMLLRLVLNS